MHIKFSATSDYSVPNNIIKDYDIGKEMGVSYQELSTRGPETGQYLNKVCQEVYFIIDGRATFHVGGEVYEVEAKDVVVAGPGEPHYIETTGLKYITITSPDWYPEQAEIVE